jgi:uncharacterized membrane-anchored protein
MNYIKSLALFFLISSSAFAVEPEVENDSILLDSLDAYIDSNSIWLATLKFETNTINLANGIAEIKVPAGYKYLNAADSRKLMTLWGNPDDASTLGLLFKKDENPAEGTSYVIELSYSAEGYVEDDDAEDIDYEELLTQLKQETLDANPGRKQEGYPEATLIGWAATPFYDDVNKKLHWAKELKFEGHDVNTLNYNIRILGRNGYLQLNAIGDVAILPAVNKDLSSILSSVNFKPGHKYEDFDDDIDEIAAVGIGGLIAGKVLAKVGLWAVILKFGKIIIFGIIALFAGFKNKIFGLFKKKEKVEELPVVEDNSTPDQLPQ